MLNDVGVAPLTPISFPQHYLTGLPQNRIRDCRAFEVLYMAWRRELLSRAGNSLDADQCLDMELARRIVFAPIPDATLIRTKLEVVTYYLQRASTDMDPMTRLAFTGLSVIAIDLLQLSGTSLE